MKVPKKEKWWYWHAFKSMQLVWSFAFSLYNYPHDEEIKY